jgi:hypothetical protein
MAKYILQIPANYAARVGGNRQVSIDASSPSEAKTKVVQAGIPAAVLGTPVEIKGRITSGSLPPDASQYALPTSGPERSAVLRSDRIVGANNPTFYSRLLAGEDVGGEIVSSTPFAPNINPAPTLAQIQAAIPFTTGTPGDPFYQPPSYQPMTTADFAQIRANQFDQELLNLDAAEIANIEAAVRRQLADRNAQELINATAVSNFNNEEGSIAGGLFRDPEDAEVPKVAETGDAIPANLPEFWRERYDEYLGLPSSLQQAILDNQFQNYIELNEWQIRTGGATGEEGGGVSGTAGADVGLEELQRILGQTTGATVNPDGSISFGPGTVDPSTIDVTRRIPDPLQLQGYANTGLQDILNIFYANPDRYISEIPLFEDVYDPDTGQVIRQRQVGTQQVLSPVAEAALRAYSTQRGTESADIASRFGTATPFGAIAGLGGSAEQALGLAELQARAGVTNPYAALGTGSAIGDIGTILRGGLTPEEQLALEGLQARGGLTAEQRLAELGTQYNPFSETAQNRLDLARAQASGGLTNELNILAAQQAAAANNPFAAAQLGIDIGNISTILRGGLTPNQQLALAQAPGNPFGLTAQQQIDLQNQLARGGLTAQEQSALVGLQARGGLTVQEQLNLAGFQARGGLTAQERLAEQRLAALSPLLQASPGTLGGLSRVLGGEAQLQGLFSPFTSDTSATGMANVMQQTSPTPFTTQSTERPRQTIGGYQRADLFDRGAIEAEAGMAGEELDRYLGQVSLGAGSPRGSLGAQLA